MTEPIHAPHKDWDAVYNAAAQLDPLACCLAELRDRIVALEAAGVTIDELTLTLEYIDLAKLVRLAWAAARAEVERQQQGGQADG